MWPHPEDLFLGGSKLHIHETLRVVSLSMGLSTPMYVTVDLNDQDSSFLKEVTTGKVQGVLPTDSKVASKVKKVLGEKENTWKRVQSFFGRPK